MIKSSSTIRTSSGKAEIPSEEPVSMISLCMRGPDLKVRGEFGAGSPWAPFQALRPAPTMKPARCHCVVSALVDTRALRDPKLYGRAGHFGMDARSGNDPGGSERPYNNLLRRLSTSDFALIAPHLVQEQAEAGELLYNPGDDVEIVHFPCGPSLASYLVPSEDSPDVQTMLVGREGAVG